MPQISKGIFTGIFAAAGVALTLGAVPLALGRDLSLGPQAATGTPESAINRAAKADRGTAVASPAAPMRTIALQLNGFSDTSVLVRIPLAQAGRTAPEWTRSGPGKFAAACEPVVSVLTDIAKRLQPGRCVT